MNSEVLLAVTALVVYIVMAICALIPICIVAKKSSKDCNFSRGTERIISFCNCMAGGVFIAMCFLGLLPYAQDKTRKVLEDLNIKTDFPVAEFTCILGFFLIMSVEQLVLQCQHSKNKAKGPWEISPKLDETDRSSKLNYYKTVKDESASEQLLVKNSMEAVLPESPSILKEANIPRIYQNVPMVTFKEEDSDEMPSPKKKISHPGPNCSHHQVERLLKNKAGGTLRLALLYMAISIHSLFEGMALGLQTDPMKIFHLFFAIVFHEALIAFSVGITMARQQLTLKQGVKYILIFSLSVPLGIFLGLIVQQAPGTGGSVASAIFQSLAAGIFIHVTFLELVPAELSNSRDRMAKVAFHFLGFIAMALVTITMGSHHWWADWHISSTWSSLFTCSLCFQIHVDSGMLVDTICALSSYVTSKCSCCLPFFPRKTSRLVRCKIWCCAIKNGRGRRE